MKRYLLPKDGTFYKANLHCHTTVSDGQMTPQEVKDHYMAHGYSIVAFTDHCVLIGHPELKEENFLPLNGIEIEVVPKDPEEPVSRRKHNHICYVALEEDNVTMPFYNPKYIWGDAVAYADQIKWDPKHEDHIREFTPECINEMIRIGKDAGFFVTYNHPTWSQEHYNDYMAYNGMHAMEILNYGSAWGGYGDYNPHIYDDMLLGGKRLYAIATDDNHAFGDTCGGWTMIKAEKLDYRTVTRAMEDGSFYASWGPEIKELWFEDGKVHIACSPAARIICHCGPWRPYIRISKDGPLTEAEFEIKEKDQYFRITVMDENGRCADTNAYFTDELF